MERKNAWKSYDENNKKELEILCKEYREFLSAGKTERECVKQIIAQAESAGYRNLDVYLKSGEKLKCGDKIYSVCMNKTVAMFQIGKEPLDSGMNILGAHIDSPRMDIKQNPLYEDSDLAYLDTHYYGGIKKYQWVTIPHAIHGVIAKKDGSVVEVNIGENDDDPVFCVSDLLIHLAANQMEKKASKVIEGEKLDVLVGSIPLNDEEKEAVSKGVLAILKEKYGMEEEDFMSSELEVVPAGKARELGFDRSMIMSYGQDDRVCAYNDLKLRRCLANSKMLSSDVNAGYDPLFADAFEKKNASFCGRGVVFSKFTGSRGKSGSNDANAEYIAKLRKIMDDNNVHYQMAELGKVDVGGGGTIAYIMSLYGMEVIDCGVAILNMHAPWEVASKADVYEAKKCYEAFLKN